MNEEGLRQAKRRGHPLLKNVNSKRETRHPTQEISCFGQRKDHVEFLQISQSPRRERAACLPVGRVRGQDHSEPSYRASTFGFDFSTVGMKRNIYLKKKTLEEAEGVSSEVARLIHLETEPVPSSAPWVGSSPNRFCKEFLAALSLCGDGRNRGESGAYLWINRGISENPGRRKDAQFVNTGTGPPRDGRCHHDRGCP